MHSPPPQTAAQTHLRRCIAQGQLQRRGHALLAPAPKVNQLHGKAAGEPHDVGWPQVAVDNAPRVQGADSLAHHVQCAVQLHIVRLPAGTAGSRVMEGAVWCSRCSAVAMQQVPGRQRMCRQGMMVKWDVRRERPPQRRQNRLGGEGFPEAMGTRPGSAATMEQPMADMPAPCTGNAPCVRSHAPLQHATGLLCPSTLCLEADSQAAAAAGDDHRPTAVLPSRQASHLCSLLLHSDRQ